MAAADEQLPSVNKPEESDAVSQPEKSDADGKEAPIDEAKTEEVDKTPAIEEPVDSSKTAEDDSRLENGRTSPNGEKPKSPTLSTAGSPKPVSIPEAQLDENKDLDEVNGDNTTDKPDLDAKASSFESESESESAPPVEAEALVSQKKSREEPDTEPVVSPTAPTQSEEPLNEDPIKETEEAVASCTVANSSPLKPKAEPVELDPEKSVESIESASEVKQELVTVVKLTVAAKDKESTAASKSRRKDTLAPEPLQETLEDANTDNQGRRRSLRIRSSSSKKYTEAELGDEEPECIPLDPPTPSPAKDLKDPLLVGRKVSIMTTKPSKPSFRISDLPLPKSISMTPVTLKKEPQQQPMLLPQPPASSAHAGFVIIDTTSLLAGKGPVPVSVSSITTSAASPIILNPPPTPVRLMGGNKAPTSRIKTHQISSSASTSCSTPSSTNSSNSTADLFAKHGLTDDSYIVEAPSFIVPYIIEKSGEKSLKKFLDTEKENKEEESKKKKLQQLPKKVEKSPKKDGDVIMVSEGEEEEEEDEEEEDEDREEDSSESEANPTAKTTSKPINRFTGDAGSYFETPLGKFFADIGLGLVQEFMQDDMLRIQKRRLAKGGRAAAAAMAADTGMSVAALEKNLQVSRTKNQAYHLDKVHKCNLCSFKTESVLVLSHHREAPHIQGNRYLCNFCSMETREAAQALVHMLQHHGIRGRVEPHIFFHQCIFCPFEDHLKTKVTRHVFTCQKRFRPEKNMEPPADWEPPAKIPRMPNRPQKGLHGIGGAMNALGPSSPFGAPGKLTHLPSMVHPLLGKSHLSSLGLPPLIPANGMSSANNKNNRNNNYNNAAAAAALAGIKLPSEKSNKGGAYRNSALYLPTNYAVQGNIYQLMNSTGGVMPMLPSLPLLSKKSANNAVSITPTTATLVPSLAHSSSLSISGSSGGIMTATAMSSSSSSSKSSSRLPQQPSISITPLPRPSAANAGSSSSAASASAKASSNAASAMSVRAVSGSDANAAAAMGIKAGQPAQPGQKTNLVICEICDGCIKDLEQLRNHMHWIHKVKIHPKMIHNRPPLNCQKCQFRFFTDQGLERHLLGSHGLVTSSMQESANKGQDGGRCPICGKVYQWKLLSHVAKDHGLTLKPAHLSYKCTVCTATFNMYKLFENHVYTAHSVVAKKVLDKKGGAEGSRAESNHTSSGKSMKINDEITIIPQPARGSASASTSASSSSTVSVSVSVSAINKGDETDKSCQGCGQNLERHRRDREHCSTCARKMRDPLREPSQEKDEDHGSSRRRRRERKGEAVDVIDLSGDEDGGAANVPVSVPLGKSEITITKVKATSSSLAGGKHSGVQLIRLPEGTKSNAAATLHAGDVEMTVSVSKVSQRKRPANEEVTGGAGKRPRHD